jgi:hypothetical protein
MVNSIDEQNHFVGLEVLGPRAFQCPDFTAFISKIVVMILMMGTTVTHPDVLCGTNHKALCL